MFLKQSIMLWPMELHMRWERSPTSMTWDSRLVSWWGATVAVRKLLQAAKAWKSRDMFKFDVWGCSRWLQNIVWWFVKLAQRRIRVTFLRSLQNQRWSRSTWRGWGWSDTRSTPSFRSWSTKGGIGQAPLPCCFTQKVCSAEEEWWNSGSMTAQKEPALLHTIWSLRHSTYYSHVGWFL